MYALLQSRAGQPAKIQGASRWQPPLSAAARTGCGCTCCGDRRKRVDAPDAAGAAIPFDFGRLRIGAESPASSPVGLADKNADGDAGAPPPADAGPVAGAPAQPADAGAPPAGAKPACPAGQEAGLVRGCIQLVVIADDDGTNPTHATSVAKAQEVWKKCCIDFSLASTVTVKKKSYKKLDESEDNTPTDQEKNLFKEVASSACVQVFFPDTLKMGGAEGKDVNGGGGTYEGGGDHPKIVLVDGALPEVLAHEIGHAAGYHGHAGSAGTVMEATNHYNVANKTTVSADVCTRARSGSMLTAPNAAKDCCETIP